MTSIGYVTGILTFGLTFLILTECDNRDDPKPSPSVPAPFSTCIQVPERVIVCWNQSEEPLP